MIRIPIDSGRPEPGRVLPAGASLALLLVVAGAVHGDTTDFAFGDPERIPLPEDVSATCIELRDRDGDGDLDAVLTTRSTDHFVLLMDGGPDGTLSIAGQLESPGQTDWLQTADLDGDGALDLVTAVRTTAGMLAIYDGDGTGGFIEPPRLLPMGREIRHVSLDDMNGDGVLDILAVGHRSEDFHVLLGDGSGGFQASDRRRLAPWINGSVYPQSLVNEDLDGDGNRDAVLVSIGARTLHLVMGRGDGTLETPRAWVAPRVDGELGGCAYITSTDFDSDGLLEFLAPQTTWGQQWFVFFELDESGTIVSSEPMMASPFGISWISEAADFDGDGDEDLCIGHALPGVVIFMENVTVPGEGTTFNDPQWFFTGEFIRHVVAADIDFDGDQDLLAIDYTGDQILLFRNGSNPGFAGSVSSEGDLPVALEIAPGSLKGLDGPELLRRLAEMTPAEIRAIAMKRDRLRDGGAE